MKNRLLLTLVLMLASVAVSRAEFRWGPTAGANFSKFYFKQDLVGVSQQAGVQAGVMGEIMIPGIGFGVDVAVRYNMHGSKVNFGERYIWSSDGIGNENVTLHTVEIPINLRFKYTRLQGFERILAPLAYVGPVFSFTAGHSDAKALEYPAGCVGIQVGIGGELFEHFQLTAGYMWGLTYEVRTIKLDNFSARSQCWTINAAYFF